MSAMNYEIIIRKAYDVSRYEVPEADATIYSRCEQKVRAVELEKEAKEKGEPRYSNISIDDLEYEARRAAAHIGINLIKAINHVLETNYNIEESKTELEEIKSALSREYDIEKIESLMDRINPIFKKIC